MSDNDALTPRVFFARHGDTEWSKSGRYTSFTEIDLTPAGISKITSAASSFVGKGKLIDPRRLVHVFASPRIRARSTLELLLPSILNADHSIVTYTDDITEWDYGQYEGLKEDEIRSLRRDKGLDKERQWDIWTDGCEDGESVQQVTDRLDRLISRIKDIQRPCMDGKEPADVILVAHGLILRCFVKRWLGHGISDNLSMILDPGAIGVLSYKKKNVDEPAIHVGI